MAPALAESIMNGDATVKNSGPSDAATLKFPYPGNLQEDSKYAASCLLWKVEQMFAFHAAMKLKIPDILGKAAAQGKPGLSAEEILKRLPSRSSPAGPQTVLNLRRLLQPLVVDGIFARSVIEDSKIIYSLTALSKWFVEDNEFNLLGCSDFQRARPLRKAFENIEQVILDDVNAPFENTNDGLSMYDYGNKDPEFGTIISTAMTSWTNFETPALMETFQQSGVLEGLKDLVDVGGGVGTFLAQIVAKNPHIHGINFDLPHVVNVPEAVKGVEHIGGSFTERVPSGDAMILKMIIHNHGDEESIVILRKCYEALPPKGKVLIVEYLLPEMDDHNPSWKSRMAIGMDLSMLTLLKGARERTLKEYAALTSAAGFSPPTLVSSPGCIDIIQAFKS